MAPSGNDRVVTLRNIYDVVMDTREKVITLTQRVDDLEKIPKKVDKVSDRTSVLERGHAKMLGIAVGAATVGGTAVSIMGWLIAK